VKETLQFTTKHPARQSRKRNSDYLSQRRKELSAAQPQPKKKGKYLAQSPQRSPSLRDQNYFGPGLRGLCELGVLGASKSYVSDSCGRKQIAASRHGQTHQLGGMKLSSQLANNFDYCSAKAGLQG
jgi:hypothetical protein